MGKFGCTRPVSGATRGRNRNTAQWSRLAATLATLGGLDRTTRHHRNTQLRTHLVLGHLTLLSATPPVHPATLSMLPDTLLALLILNGLPPIQMKSSLDKVV